MARACTICTHGEALAIDAALARAESYRNIAERFGVALGSLSRHTRACIPLALEAVRAQRQQESGFAVERELLDGLTHVKKLRRAVDRWLSDPDLDGEYTVEPRANEISVIYEDLTDVNAQGVPKKARAFLSELLAQAERSANATVLKVQWKQADNRQLLLNCLNEFRGWLDYEAKLSGRYQKERENDRERKEKAERFERLITVIQKRFHLDRSEAVARVAEHEPTVREYVM